MTHNDENALHSDFDAELVADFRGEFTDACENIQHILIKLERAQDKHDGLHELFRALHSVKSNLRMMQLNQLSEFIHSMENILDDMREERLAFDMRFSDVLLLSLEKVRDTFNAIFAGDDAAIQELLILQDGLEQMHMQHQQFDQHMHALLLQLDPGLVQLELAQQPGRAEDLIFFRDLANFIEHRLGYDDDAISRTSQMAEQMNAIAGNPVHADQLRLAVYVHDVGMAFLPNNITDKPGDLSEEDKHSLFQHPKQGYHLLAQLGGWSEAAQMVLQHHERVDGLGYPAGCRTEHICAGAKILAIVDTYEAMTQKRAHRAHKRTALRVVAEINAQSTKQFDPHWVDVFNQWVRRVYLK